MHGMCRIGVASSALQSFRMASSVAALLAMRANAAVWSSGRARQLAGSSPPRYGLDRDVFQAEPLAVY